jgi:isochorismate hydrolase
LNTLGAVACRPSVRPLVCFLQLRRHDQRLVPAATQTPFEYRMRTALVDAEPEAIAIDPRATALVIIDMQRDFLEPGGFGASLGNDVSLLAAAVAPCGQLLAAARRLGMLVIHTREGHRADLSDAPRAKVERGAAP